eukprot:CAMPEP_0181381198 /NCGR_PEP_ID=MMETSP1106-20121128/19987_1 /TAXON_ID=81844 /ORGANISM="Mantoniella antarctica, Strain SL-175" /LENGTH=53 /DNA_ID=CAMNT_0023500353 /DNA_START=57 /DNA_END=214 /DNA_ORIENTATION=+
MGALPKKPWMDFCLLLSGASDALPPLLPLPLLALPLLLALVPTAAADLKAAAA